MHQGPNTPFQTHIANFLSMLSDHILQFSHLTFFCFSLYLDFQAQMQPPTGSIPWLPYWNDLLVLSALLIHEFPLNTNDIHCHIIFHLEEGSSYLCAQWFINLFFTQPHSVYYCLYFIVKKSTTRSSSPSPIDPNSLTSVKMSLQLSKCRNARTSREWPEGGRGEGWLQKQGDQSFFGGRSVTR